MTTAALVDGRRYLSWQEAARYSGLSVMSLRRLVEAGRLRLLMPMARCPRLDKVELDGLMQAGSGNSDKAGG